MDDRQLAEEAASWLLRLEEDSSPACKADFSAWLSRSPAHMEQFLLSTAAYRELDGLDPQHTLAVDLQALEISGEERVRRFPLRLFKLRRNSSVGRAEAVASAPGRRKRLTAMAAAAALVTCGAVAAWIAVSSPSGPRTYATALGEQRAIKLGDDSVVQLNTRSRVEVRLTDELREVRLLEGEALFAVEHDPGRPFRVVTRGAVIQAIGTQFNVYRQESPDVAAATKVAVVQGAVKVSTAAEPGQLLSAGEEAVVQPDGRVIKHAAVEVSRSIAWRQRKLDFRGAALEEVARQFNRYNRVQIRIDDPGIAQRELNGVFNADEPDSLLEFLAQESGVRVEKRNDQIVIGRQ